MKKLAKEEEEEKKSDDSDSDENTQKEGGRKVPGPAKQFADACLPRYLLE